MAQTKGQPGAMNGWVTKTTIVMSKRRGFVSICVEHCAPRPDLPRQYHATCIFIVSP